MNPSYWPSVLNTCKIVTQRVSAQLMQDFAQVASSTKADGSVITRSDEWADRELKESLAYAFPDHSFLTEEGDRTFPSSDWCWVIDPIDGTNNFARGIPVWATSLALLYKGTPVFGFLSVPAMNQTLYGYYQDQRHLPSMPANSAYLNDRPIHPSRDPITRNHFLSLCSRSAMAIGELPCKRRMLGAAAYNLATVAMGSTLGCIESSPKVWDIAAVWVIVHGSGAIWQPLDGNAPFPLKPGYDYTSRPFPTIAASRPDYIDVFKETIIAPL